ncbi:hypothetical protein D3C80_1601620 [compost metagenome]
MAASKCGRAMATKATRAAIFTSTSTAFSVALSLVPMSSRPVTTAMMKTAGRLIRPPSTWGPTVRASGRSMPSPARKGMAYPDQPTATAETTSEYSRIRLHPTTQAKISPSEA